MFFSSGGIKFDGHQYFFLLDDGYFHQKPLERSITRLLPHLMLMARARSIIYEGQNSSSFQSTNGLSIPAFFASSATSMCVSIRLGLDGTI